MCVHRGAHGFVLRVKSPPRSFRQLSSGSLSRSGSRRIQLPACVQQAWAWKSLTPAFPGQVQRPVTELTLDCDTLVNELERDSENRGTIYLAGVSRTFKEHLLQQSSLFLGLEAVILPKDLRSGKQKKYCFLSKCVPGA